MGDPSEIPEKDDKLREALRNLPKIKAPWYFDARLQQRIRGSHNEAPRKMIRPIPAFAMLAVVFVCTGIVGYFAYFSPQDSNQFIESEAIEIPPSVIPAPAETPVILPSSENEGRSGPNAGSSGDLTIESGLVSANSKDDSTQGRDTTGKASVDSTITGQ